MYDYKVLFYFLESNFCYFFTYKLSEFSLFFDILNMDSLIYILHIEHIPLKKHFSQKMF